MRAFLIIFLFMACEQGAQDTNSETVQDRELRRLIARTNLKANTFKGNKDSKYQLGKKLFHDKALSPKQDIACVSCHQSTSTENLALSVGTERQILKRNSQQLFNLGQSQNFAFHDGRVFVDETKISIPNRLSNNIINQFEDALDAQILFPILSREEMRGSLGTHSLADIEDNEEYLSELLQTNILSQTDYLEAFKQSYPEDANPGHLANAIGHFIRAEFNVTDTPYDRYLLGDNSSLTEAQKRGFRVFLGKGQCIRCHNGVHLSDSQFHSIGVPQIFAKLENASDDLGRASVTNNLQDLYKFKTPGLRNIAKTAPFMHDGAFGTLAEVVEHYNNIGESLFHYRVPSSISGAYTVEITSDLNQERNSKRFNQIDHQPLKRGLRLSPREQEDLVLFLHSLSSD